MANLTWGDVVVIGVVATIGFTLLSFWFSGIMNRRNWSWQVKAKPVKKPEPGQQQPPTGGASSP